jgi:hypothetical protein
MAAPEPTIAPQVRDALASLVAKSMIVVVPPKAAAFVPVSKSSDEFVPPNGMSMCVCGSMPPGNTSLLLARFKEMLAGE